jgi:hypothetical protein
MNGGFRQTTSTYAKSSFHHFLLQDVAAVRAAV